MPGLGRPKTSHTLHISKRPQKSPQAAQQPEDKPQKLDCMLRWRLRFLHKNVRRSQKRSYPENAGFRHILERTSSSSQFTKGGERALAIRAKKGVPGFRRPKASHILKISRKRNKQQTNINQHEDMQQRIYQEGRACTGDPSKKMSAWTWEAKSKPYPPD